MARRKNAPHLVKVKCGVAERLRELRTERYGERGGPELARSSSALPVRTWYEATKQVLTVPAEVVLRVIEPDRCRGELVAPRHIAQVPRDPQPSVRNSSETSVQSLLRTVYIASKRGDLPLRDAPSPRRYEQDEDKPNSPLNQPNLILVNVDDPGHEQLTHASGPRFVAAHREWHAAELEHRCLHISDDSMAPLIADGAYVAYSEADDSFGELDGRPACCLDRRRAPDRPLVSEQPARFGIAPRRRRPTATQRHG